MKMNLMAIAILLTLVSCGNKGGGSSGEQSTRTAQSDLCGEHFTDSSDLRSVAVRASEIALHCGLSEEELVKLAREDFSQKSPPDPWRKSP